MGAFLIVAGLNIAGCAMTAGDGACFDAARA